MSSPTESVSQSDQRPLIALIPPLAGAVVAFLLRDAGEFAQFAGSAATVLVSGAPIYQRAVTNDRKRSANQAPDVSGSRGSAAAASKPGLLTVALSIILGGTAFWLVQFLVFAAGFNLIGFSPTLAYADAATAYFYTAVFCVPLILAASFPIAVLLAHRLRDAATPALAVAVALSAIGDLATNVVLTSQVYMTELLPTDILIPLVQGALLWLTVYFACKYARRTQYRYDAMRTARPDN